MAEASIQLSPEGIDAYLEAARYLGKMGRGAEPVLIFLQEWPQVASTAGESALPAVINAVRVMTKSPNSQAIGSFLQSLAAVARRIPSLDQLQTYLDISLNLMESTSGSIHGIHKTYPSPSLPDYFVQSPHLLSLLTLEGLRNWVTYGVRNYNHHPEQQCDYFSLRSADSRAVMQRERHGTLLIDNTRKLDLYLQGLWQDADHLVPYATASDAVHQSIPYFDAQGIRLPDVYDERNGVKGIDRYRAVLAHMAAHRRWSTAIFADNYSPMQRMAIEMFEDARVEALAMREYPGLRRFFAALHPIPVEGACNPATHSCLRHRLTMLSRALLDSSHGYSDVKLNEFVTTFSRRYDARRVQHRRHGQI